MNKQFDQVKQFHAACGIEMPDKPTLLESRDMQITNSFASDLQNLCREMKDHPKCEVLQRASWMLEELIEFMSAETIEDQADALCDLQYFSIGTNTLIGVKPEPIFNIVQAANMGKVGPDGKVLRDEQGKIRKPEGWHENFAPEGKIRAEIERQSNT